LSTFLALFPNVYYVLCYSGPLSTVTSVNPVKYTFHFPIPAHKTFLSVPTGAGPIGRPETALFNLGSVTALKGFSAWAQVHSAHSRSLSCMERRTNLEQS